MNHTTCAPSWAPKVSREVWHKAGEMGLLGVNCPEAYGGLGLDIRFAAVGAVPWQHIAAFVWRVGCDTRAPPRRRPLQPSGDDSAKIRLLLREEPLGLRRRPAECAAETQARSFLRRELPEVKKLWF